MSENIRVVRLTPRPKQPYELGYEDWLPEGIPTLGVDLEEIPRAASSAQSVTWPRAVMLDDEALSPAFNFTTELEEPPPVNAVQKQLSVSAALGVTTRYTVSPFLDDEILAPAGNFPYEQEENPPPQTQYRPWLPSPFLDDEALFTITAFPYEQEENPPPKVQTITWLPLTFPYDETTGTFLLFFREQEENPLPSVTVIPPYKPAFSDDEVGSSLLTFSGDLEDAVVLVHRPYPLQPPASTYDEMFPSAASFVSLEDELGFTNPFSQEWRPRVQTDDEIIESWRLDNEDQPQFPAQAQYIPPPVATLYDETGVSLLLFGLEDEPPYTAPVMSIIWATREYRDDTSQWPLASIPEDEYQTETRYWPLPYRGSHTISQEEVLGAAQGITIDDEYLTIPSRMETWVNRPAHQHEEAFVQFVASPIPPTPFTDVFSNTETMTGRF